MIEALIYLLAYLALLPARLVCPPPRKKDDGEAFVYTNEERNALYRARQEKRFQEFPWERQYYDHDYDTETKEGKD